MKQITILIGIATTLSCANPTLQLSDRQLCDLELILNEGFTPLKEFMNKNDYDSVVEHMRLANGSVWPMPITLDVTKEFAHLITPGTTINLTYGTQYIAELTVSDIWQPNKQKEARQIYGTTSTDHPGVHYLLTQTHPYYIGGTVKASKSYKLHYDFESLRKTPAELKAHFKNNGIQKVVAFQTRNPMHRAHFELTKRAAEQHQAHLLIHPVVGLTKPGDVDYITRIRCYKKVINHFAEGAATLSLLPIAMRMAGPREALWHALIRKNYGCTHFIIGRDHAGPGPDSNGNDFYGPYEAQELVKQYAEEIDITVVPFQEMVYIAEDDCYYPRNEAPTDKEILTISGTQFRRMLANGTEVPSWFSFPEVIKELRKTYPPHHKKGLTLFITGLSGAGKSTIAQALAQRLAELQERPISLLDGDEIRKNLSSELGFSKEHRSLNVRRVGYVAQEISKNGGLALCSLIAPYEKDRLYNRQQISKNGTYIEIYISTPLRECEKRDVKGLYQKAREGIIPQFTGISDPYEEPKQPEITIDTTHSLVEESVDTIITYLKQHHYINN